MRLTTLFIALWVFFNSCKLGPSVSEETFTRIYRDSLAILHPTASYTINKDLEITANFYGKEISHFLVNAYNEYKAHPRSLKSIISRYTRSSSGLYKTDPVNKNKIIPIIKDTGYPDSVKTTIINQYGAAANDLQLVYDVYNEKLVVLYAEDTGTNASYLTEERFRELGLPKDSLLPLSIRNFSAIIPEIKTSRDNGLNRITAGGNYESSLILLSNIWNSNNMQVFGKIIIAIPTCNLLFVTGANNSNGVKTITERANQAWQNGKCRLLPDLFIWNGNKFEVYK